MSEARDIYLRVWRDCNPWFPGHTEAIELLRNAARLWRQEKRLFSAAIAEIDAAHAALHVRDTEQFQASISQAWKDFDASIESDSLESYESIASICQWLQLFSFFERHSVAQLKESLLRELAHRLIKEFGESADRDSYLVRGIILTTDFDGKWEVEFPNREVRGSSNSRHGRGMSLEVKSAFRLLLEVGDYQGAHEIVIRCSTAFVGHGLQGWALAVKGILDHERAAQYFDDAADVFSQDTLPSSEDLQDRGSWDSSNVDLWAKYFRARALVAQIPQNKNDVLHLLKEASQVLGSGGSGWADSQVSRFRLLVNALIELLESGTIDVVKVLQKLRGDQRMLGETQDDGLIQQFIEYATQSFESFRSDPVSAVTEGKLTKALDCLAQIQLIGPYINQAVTPAIGKKAVTEFQGPYRTWIYRALESISDERLLQRIIVRLEEAHIPRFAHLRHGPLEYGKDVVCLFEKDGRRILRMWQVKAGDINTPKWRASKDELEEMYLVPLSTFQIAGEVDEHEGILVCNGHANANVEPVMQGWFVQQEKNGRTFRFMHLDDLVNWIVDNRLINEFRAVLTELGVPII